MGGSAGRTIKHARTSTGSIAGGATVTVTCTWVGGAFANTNYTATAVVEESSISNNTLEVLKILNLAAGSIQAVVRNNDAINAKTGTVHAIGIAD